MAFAQEPSELETGMVGRDFEREFSSTCNKFSGDLSSIAAATELMKARSLMFSKMDSNELLRADEHSIVVLGNVTGEEWTTYDLFDLDGNPSVSTLAFYVHGGQIASNGLHVFHYLMPILKRPGPGATAGAPTARQTAAEGFPHPESIQVNLNPGSRMLVVNPRSFYAKTGDAAVRQKYEEIVAASKRYVIAIRSPGLNKRTREEEDSESRKGGVPKGLFDTTMPAYYDRKNGVSVRSITSKAIVAANLEETSFCLRLGGPQSMAFLPDRTPNFPIYIRTLNLTAQQMTDVAGQQLAMATIAEAAGGAVLDATLVKDTKQVSLFDQTRTWSYLQRTLPELFAIDAATGDPKTLTEFLFKGQFGKPLTLDDFGKVKRHEITVGAQHEEKPALDLTLSNHQALVYAAHGGPWKHMWEPIRELIRSGPLQGHKLRASYALTKLNEAYSGWNDKIHTCGWDSIPGYDLKVVGDVFRYFQDSMEIAALSMTGEDQLGFLDNISAGVHPNDLLFGKRPRKIAVVTPDKGGKRKDEATDKKPNKTKKVKVEDHEDDPPGNHTDGKVCDYHLLHLLGIRNDDSFRDEARRGKVMACGYGDKCKHSHPESVTKSAALKILKGHIHKKSILAKYKEQALEAAELLG